MTDADPAFRQFWAQRDSLPVGLLCAVVFAQVRPTISDHKVINSRLSLQMLRNFVPSQCNVRPAECLGNRGNSPSRTFGNSIEFNCAKHFFACSRKVALLLQNSGQRAMCFT